MATQMCSACRHSCRATLNMCPTCHPVMYCGRCLAEPGDPCRSGRGRPVKRFHDERVKGFVLLRSARLV